MKDLEKEVENWCYYLPYNLGAQYASYNGADDIVLDGHFTTAQLVALGRILDDTPVAANDPQASDTEQLALRLLVVLHAWYRDPNHSQGSNPHRGDELYPANQSAPQHGLLRQHGAFMETSGKPIGKIEWACGLHVLMTIAIQQHRKKYGYYELGKYHPPRRFEMSFEVYQDLKFSSGIAFMLDKEERLTGFAGVPILVEESCPEPCLVDFDGTRIPL